MSELQLKVESMTESKYRAGMDELCTSVYDLCTRRHSYGGFLANVVYPQRVDSSLARCEKDPGRVEGAVCRRC